MNEPSPAGRDRVLALFDRKARSWSNKYDAGGVLVSRIAEFSTALRALSPPPATIVDFGCGTGELARALDELGYQVTGCDFSPAMIAQAVASTSPASDVTFVTLDADWETLPFAAGSVNAVVASSVFEYLDDPAQVARECSRILVDSGILLFNVPNPDHPTRKAEAALASILAHSSGLAAAAKRVPRLAGYQVYLEVSRNRWPIAQWCAQMAKAGFSRVERQSSPVGPRVRPRAALILLAFVKANDQRAAD